MDNPAFMRAIDHYVFANLLILSYNDKLTSVNLHSDHSASRTVGNGFASDRFTPISARKTVDFPSKAGDKRRTHSWKTSV